MQLRNHVRVLVLLPVALLLAACASQRPAAYTRMLSGSANPIGVQTGRLVVVAYDSADGGPLMQATVDIVSADQNVREPNFYRRIGISDRRGMVTFTDVPRAVNIFITHPRGTYGQDNYVVPQNAPSEFRVYIDTEGQRTRDECLGFQLCGR